MITLATLNADVYELKMNINLLRNVCVKLANKIEDLDRNWNDLRNDINNFESEKKDY